MLKNNNLTIGIVIIILFCACNRTSIDNNTERLEDKETSFEEIISNIPILTLPYTIHCGLEESLPNAKDFGLEVSKMLPEHSIMAGRLPINNDYIYIIYGEVGDILYPYLNIYDKSGKKIDSLYLHIGDCSDSEWTLRTISTTIGEDFSIIMTDSTKSLNYTDDNEEIIDSIIVKKNNFKITKNGLYKKENEESDRIQ